MKKILEKLGDFGIFLNKKFEKISEMIYERTGKRVNVGEIVLLMVLAIIMFFVVKEFLKWLFSLI